MYLSILHAIFSDFRRYESLKWSWSCHVVSAWVAVWDVMYKRNIGNLDEYKEGLLQDYTLNGLEKFWFAITIQKRTNKQTQKKQHAAVWVPGSIRPFSWWCLHRISLFFRNVRNGCFRELFNTENTSENVIYCLCLPSST